MVRGRHIVAQIDIPQTVYIPSRGKHVEIPARVSLHNTGEEDFVAHAASGDDRHFWHVLNADHHEILREKGRGKGGATGVKVRKGVHSYRTRAIPRGQGVQIRGGPDDLRGRLSSQGLDQLADLRGRGVPRLLEGAVLGIRHP